jgi:hypothetical protein
MFKGCEISQPKRKKAGYVEVDDQQELAAGPLSKGGFKNIGSKAQKGKSKALSGTDFLFMSSILNKIEPYSLPAHCQEAENCKGRPGHSNHQLL